MHFIQSNLWFYTVDHSHHCWKKFKRSLYKICKLQNSPGLRIMKQISSKWRYLLSFLNDQNTSSLLNITFIFMVLESSVWGISYVTKWMWKWCYCVSDLIIPCRESVVKIECHQIWSTTTYLVSWDINPLNVGHVCINVISTSSSVAPFTNMD